MSPDLIGFALGFATTAVAFVCGFVVGFLFRKAMREGGE